MCLAIPGKVVEIYEVEVGQYVVVHAGFAIQILDEEQAQEVFEAWDELTDTLKDDGYEVTSKPLSKKKKDLN